MGEESSVRPKVKQGDMQSKDAARLDMVGSYKCAPFIQRSNFGCTTRPVRYVFGHRFSPRPGDHHFHMPSLNEILTPYIPPLL